MTDPQVPAGASAPDASARDAGAAALEVEGLTVRAGDAALVAEVSFRVGRGERVGLIGESGSGKSVTALAVMGLLSDTLDVTGDIRVAASGNLVGRPDRAVAPLRGLDMSMVFQEPMTALDPLQRVGAQVAEVMTIHGTAGRAAASARAVELLGTVGLPDPSFAARAYPHQLSGGQRQRVMIAMALANDPALLIADEPTTALDVTVQRQVLELLLDLVRERDTGLLFITHDLAVVASVCDRVLVMERGRIVESGPISRVFTAPEHPYTRGLLAASDLAATDAEGRLFTVATAGAYVPGRRAAPAPDAAAAPAPAAPAPAAPSEPSQRATSAPAAPLEVARSEPNWRGGDEGAPDAGRAAGDEGAPHSVGEGAPDAGGEPQITPPDPSQRATSSGSAPLEVARTELNWRGGDEGAPDAGGAAGDEGAPHSVGEGAPDAGGEPQITPPDPSQRATSSGSAPLEVARSELNWRGGDQRAAASGAEAPVVRVAGLEKTYTRRGGWLRGSKRIEALGGIDLEIGAGERFGVVGESGSGKSTLLRILAGLSRPTTGEVEVAGTRLDGAREQDLGALRRQLQIVFQDPMGSLDPRMRVRDIVAEPLLNPANLRSGVAATTAERRELVARVLDQVGLPVDAAERYPHEFSGGQRQRISIARALVVKPAVLLADEPVSALDVSVRAQVLNLLADLIEEHRLTLVFVSHDLGVVRYLCDRVAVMHRGRIVEIGPTEQIYERPRDPYTRELVQASPSLEAVLGAP